MKINIRGIDKAELLVALYNASKPLGMGYLNYIPGDISKETAQQIIVKRGDVRKDPQSNAIRHNSLYFDYLFGRVMKVDLAGDELETCFYDRDNYEGAALNAIRHLLPQSNE